MLLVFCARKSNLEKAVEAMQREEYSKAVKLLNRALPQDSLNPQVHYNLSLAYSHTDSMHQALNHYLKLVELRSSLKNDVQLKPIIANFLNLEPYASSIIPMAKMNQFKGSFSPDGEIIAVAAAKRDISNIYLVRLDGSIIEKITNGRMNTDPNFSPSGQDIVFVSDRDGNEELYLYNLKTKNIERLTDNTAQDFSPSFSSDGKEIVFVSDINGGWEIYKINLSNREITPLTKNGYWDGFPKFSTDDKYIVFSSRRTRSEDIYLMNRNGDEKILYSSPGDDNDPTLLKNTLYFKSNQSGDWEIYEYNLKNKLLIRLTYNSNPDWNPRLSRDGTKILISRKIKKLWGLYFINLDNLIPAEFIASEIKTETQR